MNNAAGSMCRSVSGRCARKPASREEAAAKRGFGAGGATSTTNRRAAAAMPIMARSAVAAQIADACFVAGRRGGVRSMGVLFQKQESKAKEQHVIEHMHEPRVQRRARAQAKRGRKERRRAWRPGIRA